MYIGRLRSEGNATVLLGACDTFRAAAVEQLGEWARRANVSIEVPTAEERGGDPVPVVTRSIRRAVAEKFDFVIIDTSGRLSNNFELIEQLQGMKAAIQKELPQVGAAVLCCQVVRLHRLIHRSHCMLSSTASSSSHSMRMSPQHVPTYCTPTSSYM
jgi:signal recognition particle GTPase